MAACILVVAGGKVKQGRGRDHSTVAEHRQTDRQTGGHCSTEALTEAEKLTLGANNLDKPRPPC